MIMIRDPYYWVHSCYRWAPYDTTIDGSVDSIRRVDIYFGSFKNEEMQSFRTLDD